MSAPTTRTTRLTPQTLEEFKAFYAGVDTFLCDCDGVLWRGNDGVAGVAETVAAIKASGRRIFFVTNNSTKGRPEYVKKLKQTAGIEADACDIVSSAFAAAEYVKQQGIKKVYVIGGAGLVEELEGVAGVTVLGPEDWGKEFEFGVMKPEDLDPEVRAVVIGFDGKFCYYKLARAACYLRYVPGCQFIATNRDASYPDAHIFTPGGGSLVAALVTGSGREPDMVAGKPSATLLDLVEKATGLDRARTVMVGDRLDTDILWGNSGGLSGTLLVMTGVTSEDALAGLPEGDATRPTHVVASFGDLGPWITAAMGPQTASQ